jgi:16S rRNA C967 or C1407 C5-methylase (RsmB/RsmF family)/NOL1/NOP2/fmu family ribosome biogenesis protein
VPVLPEEFLQSIDDIPGLDIQSFREAHEAPEPITSIRINPAKPVNFSHFSLQLSSVPWSNNGYYLNARPSFTYDPLFHAGCYYVQEASSMFLEQAIKQTVDLTQSIKVLDLCAAPGGKSTHIQSLISSDSILISNEVIKKRAGILKQNIIKWGSNNVIVTNNDPQHFARLQGFFDVIVVDAPCSGSGLFRKDNEAISEWSPENVQLCCGRQQRILTDILPSLKEGGVLIYSTCSYSKEEDEEIADWIAGEFEMQSLQLQLEPGWGIVESVSEKKKCFGYRFYPDNLKGEGFFLTCFKKTKQESEARIKPSKPDLISTKEKDVIKPWIKNADLDFIKHGNFIFAFPSSQIQVLLQVQSQLYLQYAGTTIGEIIRGKLIPDHAFALSNIIDQNVSTIELNFEQAIQYLQKKDMDLSVNVTGWQLVSYKGFKLGWVNALSNRINNYYPKEMRILKPFNTGSFEK